MKKFAWALAVLAMSAGCAGDVVHVVPAKDLQKGLYPEGGKKPKIADRAATLYLFDGNKLVPVIRRGPTKLPAADLVVRSMMCGPTDSESASGLTTAIGPEIELNGVTIVDRVAEVDFAPEFKNGTPEQFLRRVAQVVYTVSELDDVDRVAFFLNRTRLTVLDQDHNPHEEPVARARYTRFGSALTVPKSEAPLPLDARLRCRR